MSHLYILNRVLDTHVHTITRAVLTITDMGTHTMNVLFCCITHVCSYFLYLLPLFRDRSFKIMIALV